MSTALGLSSGFCGDDASTDGIGGAFSVEVRDSPPSIDRLDVNALFNGKRCSNARLMVRNMFSMGYSTVG